MPKPNLPFNVPDILHLEFVVTMLVIGLLVVLATAIGLYVLFTGRREPSCPRRTGSWFVSLLWALPVVAVLAYFCAGVSPRFQGALESVAMPVKVKAPHQVELIEAGPIEVDVARPAASKVFDRDAPEETVPAADTSADSKTRAENPPPPAWVREPSKQEGDARLVVVSSGRFLTVKEAEAKALAQATAELKKDFHAIYAQSGAWNVPVEVVRNRAIRNQHIEPVTHDFKIGGEIKPTQMYVVHLQVELSPKVRDVLYPYWREQVVTQRLWVMVGIVGLLTLVTGTISAYFRLDTFSGGAYRNRLKLAAVALIVSGGLLLAMIA